MQGATRLKTHRLLRRPRVETNYAYKLSVFYLPHFLLLTRNLQLLLTILCKSEIYFETENVLFQIS